MTDALGTVALNAYDGLGNLLQVTRDYGRLKQVTATSFDTRGDANADEERLGAVAGSGSQQMAVA